MSAELVPPPAPGPPAPAGPPDLVAAWLDGRKPATVAGYQKDIRHFAAAIGFGPPREALDYFLGLDAGPANALALAYRNSMLRDGLASATIARRLAAVRSVVKLARTLGRVGWAIEVEAPRPEPRRDVRGPEPAELRKIVRAARAAGDGVRAKRDRAILALLVGLALRRGEVVALDLADVDFAGGTVNVLGKGRREKVALDMPPEVSTALAEWVAVRGHEPGPLFNPTDRQRDPGARLTGESVRRLVARLGRAAKVPRPVRPHGVRHAQITRLLSGGETVRNVMGFSRHSKLETVMRYDDELADAAGRLAREAARALR